MKKTPEITFHFVNSNSPSVFEETLKKILLDKLLAEFAYSEHLISAG